MHNMKSANKYLYKSNELQDNTGYYDYGFRQLDPALEPWFVQDALAEDYSNHYIIFNNFVSVDRRILIRRGNYHSNILGYLLSGNFFSMVNLLPLLLGKNSATLNISDINKSSN